MAATSAGARVPARQAVRPRGRRRRTRAMAGESVACAVALLVSAVWLIGTVGGANATELFSNLAEISAPLYAGVSCLRTARRTHGRRRRAWALIGAAMLSWCCGQVIWTWYEYVREVAVPVPSMADIGFLALVPLAVAGTGALITAARGALRVLLDGLIICGSLLCVSWVAGLGMLWRAGGSSLSEWLVTLAYPIGDVVVAAMMFILLGQVGRAQRLTVGLLGTGAIALAVSDSGFTYLVANDAYRLASTVDLGWIAGFLLIGVAGAAARRESVVGSDQPVPMWTALPYAPLGVAVVTAVGASVVHGSIDPALYGVSGVLVVLVMARQLLSLRDNQRLTERLSSTVGELRGREDQLREVAFIDAVTGLANRTQFAADAAKLLVDPYAHAGLLLIDLDRFSDINDALGHDAGDDVLRRVGEVLHAVIGARGVTARLGGDQFAALVHDAYVPDLADRPLPERLTSIAREVLLALHGPITVAGVAVAIEASIGIAHAPHHGADLGVLVRRADAAMHAAKRMHAGVQTWNRHLEMRTGEDLRVLTELRSGIEKGQLRLYYQVLVNARTGEATGVEALVRWAHPKRGLLPPGAFIVTAERSGLIVALTDWVLAEAISQVGRWRRVGRTVPVSVNVSAACLARDGLPATIAGLLATHQVAAGLLTIEVTETAVMADPERVAARLDALRQIGVRISIDDFGAGNTSLSLLTRLPIDELKLDRAFVARVNESPAHAAIVQTVADLARRLQLTVVAEGVEDEATAEALRQLDFDVLQGFHFSRPGPPADLPDEMRAAVGHAVQRPDPAAAALPVRADDERVRQRLDEIVELAARACGVPASLLILVRAHHLDALAGFNCQLPELPKDHSFCEYTVTADAFVEVDDARADARFADHPAVRAAPGVRFFAGAPIHDANGIAVGALCVIDTTPARLTTDQRGSLESLARLATALLGGTNLLGADPTTQAAPIGAMTVPPPYPVGSSRLRSVPRRGAVAYTTRSIAS